MSGLLGVPEHVLEAWAREAEGNAAWRLEYHRRLRAKAKNLGRRHQSEFEDCWNCQRRMAVCRTKIRHGSLDEAQAMCDDINANGGPLSVPYRCRWSDGLHWHATTARDSHKRRRAKKRMAKLAEGRVTVLPVTDRRAYRSSSSS